MASDGAHYQRAMVVVAHPDDAEWGCAGTVAKWCAEGWEVVYVLCTDGSKGSEDPEMTSGRLVEIRKQEQLNAGKVLGLKDIVFLGYEDSMLEPTLELRRDIAREIRRHRPDVLICMNPVRSVDGEGYLGHPDHFASGEAALSAVFPSSRDRLTFTELLREGLEPHKVKEVWMMFHGDTADKFVDVSAYMDTAVDALKQHQTQVSEEDAEVGMRQWRNSTGQKVGFEFAEAFKVFQLG
ncbi:MAG TPA: PIG-L family deacetylase [Dehalococcoidia bacterium]|nr:PIG-L family deacetylase [Dehalococcoidia bacterium]MEE2927284.1 PIG-L family deacetylase [Chloroflexota bacterium]HIB12665.1 PIG-L family deacetylase [Dehalococcoidia bacterium]HIM50048.1 PIG-L family deacetylase [Dehalococcoidia bacterium]